MSALARIKKTAAQHEQERQYDKALALYARLLDGAEAGEEEVDVGLFNRAGDLALRVGDAPRAVGYFERALDLYAAGGLLNNAVALGVKILRHAPNHLSAHYTLGLLYGRKGFVGDARHHLLTYAVQMQRAGRTDEATRVLAEVAATCAGMAELRAAYDAYGALGGDPAHAASLDAGGAAPVTAPVVALPAIAAEPSSEQTFLAKPAFLDLAPPALDEELVVDVTSADALALDFLDPEPLVVVPAEPATVAVDDLLPLDMPAEHGGEHAVLDAPLPGAPFVGAPFVGAPPIAGFAGEEIALLGAADPAPAFAPASDDVTPPSADEPAGGAGLVFLDDMPAPEPLPAAELTPGPLVGAATVGVFADVDAPSAPAWAGALPNEPPPLRLADLADVAGPRSAPAIIPAGEDAPAWSDDAWAPAEHAPGRFADLLAVELAVPLAHADVASPPEAASASMAPIAPPEEEDGLDLGAWLRETTPAESTRMTTAAVPQSGDEQADFDATLRAFTAGVTRAVGHEDFDSQYDLGVAFREMGLLDEAIVQFQRAAQAPGRPLRALEALAQCFVDDGQPELALSTLAAPVAAADAAGAGDAALVGVHYLMGSAAQALGRPDDARRWLVRVVATDVRFRDASQRLAALPPPTPIR